MTIVLHRHFNGPFAPQLCSCGQREIPFLLLELVDRNPLPRSSFPASRSLLHLQLMSRLLLSGRTDVDPIGDLLFYPSGEAIGAASIICSSLMMQGTTYSLLDVPPSSPQIIIVNVPLLYSGLSSYPQIHPHLLYPWIFTPIPCS